MGVVERVRMWYFQNISTNALSANRPEPDRYFSSMETCQGAAIARPIAMTTTASSARSRQNRAWRAYHRYSPHGMSISPTRSPVAILDMSARPNATPVMTRQTADSPARPLRKRARAAYARIATTFQARYVASSCPFWLNARMSRLPAIRMPANSPAYGPAMSQPSAVTAATSTRPESALGRRAAKPLIPKSLYDSPVAQTCSGGYALVCKPPIA